MFSLLIFIILTISLIILTRRILLINLRRENLQFELIRQNHDKLKQENLLFENKNNQLNLQLDETIAFYEITKEICKTLDEEKIFISFKNQISKFIKVSDCRFVKDKPELPDFGTSTCIHLELDKKNIGYLVVSGLKEEDLEKFNILAQQFLLGIKRAILYHRVQEMAITDGLTGVLSRRHWLERFDQELERSKKFKFYFSFLMIDIDNFKMINDRYGHLVGDAILKEVSKSIKDNIRQVDLVCRYGGEEFSVILVETDKAGAQFAAERIRQAIEAKCIRVYDEDLKVTISIGISVYPNDAVNKAAIIEKADLALYRAKEAGKNRVCMHGINK